MLETQMLRVCETYGSIRVSAAQEFACNHKVYTNSTIGILYLNKTANRYYEENI
jgi:hypothetical protein